MARLSILTDVRHDFRSLERPITVLLFIMNTTTKANETCVLDRLLDPLSDRLTPAMARRLVRFRADSATQARVDELATRCNEGELTPAERREYEAYVRAIHLNSILQSKARTVLAKTHKPR